MGILLGDGGGGAWLVPLRFEVGGMRRVRVYHEEAKRGGTARDRSKCKSRSKRLRKGGMSCSKTQ
jgi:hypothetical protein